jgi:hypothetical protein
MKIKVGNSQLNWLVEETNGNINSNGSVLLCFFNLARVADELY